MTSCMWRWQWAWCYTCW